MNGPGRRWGITIGAKLAILTGGLVVLLVVCALLLTAQTRATSATYDRLLSGQVAQSLKARQMQVELKKQVQEWKDVLLRGFDPKDLADYTARFRAEDLRVNQVNAEMLASTSDAGLRSQLTAFREAHRVLDGEYAKALAVFEAANGRNPAVADRMVRGLDRPVTDLVDRMVTRLETAVANAVTQQAAQNASRNHATLLTGAGVLLALVGVLAIAVLNIVRPIRSLTREAMTAATERLPAAIAEMRARDRAGPPPSLPPFEVRTHDELRELAGALTRLQDGALALAVEQHRADRETADMLVNLGRRNQNLLGRMLGYVTELELSEQDPDVLSKLFRLDHATTRIRRNAESMLVLAGATQTRTWSRPVPVIDVVRASLSEIEDYTRVDLHHLEDAQVHGGAVADVVHLVAELLENATHFSPPTAQVTVVGQNVTEGYRLRIMDHGVGMTRQDLDETNQRLAQTDGRWGDTKLLGLAVVGRLARRRDIDVALEASAGQGITASVLLPGNLIASRPERTDGTGLPMPPAVRTGRGGDRGPQTRRFADVGYPDGDPWPSDGEPGVVVPAGVPAQWPRERAATPTPTPSGSADVAAPSAVPRRVRGAQLPDLGPAPDADAGRPDDGPGAAASLRWQLRSFQLDVQAARQVIADVEGVHPTDDTPHRPEDER